MKKSFIVILIMFLFTQCERKAEESNDIKNIIFDTDIGPDYDDVGAIAMLHAFADSGKVNILGTIASTKYPNVSRVIDVINTYFKRPDIPSGTPKGDAVSDGDFQHWSDSLIAKYPHKVKSNEESENAIKAYRKILMEQPDQSVTVVTVGFLTNLSGLLKSVGDELSPLSGEELVKRKVKLLVCMAGAFPSGREFNIWKDASSAKTVFETWPSRIIFSGVEIGEKIKTGLPLVANAEIRNSPIKDVYRISIPLAESDKGGRMSWDQTAVLVAVNGASPYFDVVPGRMIVNDDGSNHWQSAPGNHFYLVQKMSVDQVSEILNSLMMHQPSR